MTGFRKRRGECRAREPRLVWFRECYTGHALAANNSLPPVHLAPARRLAQNSVPVTPVSVPRKERIVPIAIDSRFVDGINIVMCRGRIVEGPQLIALRQRLDEALARSPDLILHLGDVDFIDSSGLGLLVRYVTRTRNANGRLTLCGASSKVTDVLNVTRLTPIFDSYDTESDAIASFYQRVSSATASHRFRSELLCVAASPDVQAYVRELLGQSGYGVRTAGNLVDGLILLQATGPRLIIVDAQWRRTRDTHTAHRFNDLADALAVIELAADFSGHDA